MHTLKRSIQASCAAISVALITNSSCLIVEAAPAADAQPNIKPTTPAATAATPTAATTPATAAVASPDAPAEKMMFKPGQELSVSTDTEDIIATYDLELARKQAAAYADSPEAAFILAVAMTRTSRVEEALKEVQRARRLAESKGGAAYFDKMIASYEKMSTAYPDDNRARYELAWAYYMKAYLLARTSRRTAAFKLAHPELAQAVSAAQAAQAAAAAKAAPANNADVVKILSGQASPAALATTLAGLAGTVGNGKPSLDSIPHIPDALEKADAADVPQIRRYYELALTKIDEILQRDPEDVWSIVYGAHLKAEYTGNLDAAMKTWRSVEAKHPNNPAPYFFLGEGYLKQGNLRESINNVSKAIALRALGN